MAIGLILAIITILITITIFTTNHLAPVKKLFNNYWFYVVVAIFGLVYFLLLRWIWDLQAWINNDDLGYIGKMSVVKSKVLLLDMCPFLAVAIPFTMLVDRKRRFLPILGWFAIVGAGITIFGQIMFEKVGPEGNVHLQKVSWWEYIFFNKLYFMMHFYIFIVAWIIILNSPSFNGKRITMAHGFALSYFLYVTICVFSLKIDRNATGLVINDWLAGGQYQVIGSWFNNLGWPAIPIVAFSLVWIWIMLMILLRNTLVLDSRYDVDAKFAITCLKSWLMVKLYK